MRWFLQGCSCNAYKILKLRFFIECTSGKVEKKGWEWLYSIAPPGDDWTLVKRKWNEVGEAEVATRSSRRDR